MITAVLALVLLAQEPPESAPPVKRGSMTLVNRAVEPLEAGAQVRVGLFKGGNSPNTANVLVFHSGKPLVTCYFDSGLWFRLPAAIPAGGRDAGFEIRWGGGRVPRRPRDVFDFHDEFAKGELDSTLWDWDRELVPVKGGSGGLTIATLPGGRSEHSPVSLSPKLGALPAEFVVDVSVAWDVRKGSPFSFAIKVEMEAPAKPTDEQRSRIADLIRDLNADDIVTRERAGRELARIGSVAIPQLEEAARTGDAESRARGAAAIDSIYKTNPAPAIASGFTCRAGEATLDRTLQLGKLRSEVKSALPAECGPLTTTISRYSSGLTSVVVAGYPTNQKVPGKPLRLHLDFWATQPGNIGQVRITRVIVRRPIMEMPEVEFGAPEPIR